MSRRSDRELESFAADLRRVTPPTPRAAFRSQLRSSLLQAPLPAMAPRRGLLEFLRPLLAAAVVIAAITGVGGYAAASSLPGDPAFAIKEAAEAVQLALAPNDDARLALLVEHSDRRLSELRNALAQRPAAVAAASEAYVRAASAVDEGLGRVRSEAPSPQREEAVKRAAEASTKHIDILEQLQPAVPSHAQDGIKRAIDAQENVHEKSGATSQPDQTDRPRPSSTTRPSPTRR